MISQSSWGQDTTSPVTPTTPSKQGQNNENTKTDKITAPPRIHGKVSRPIIPANREANLKYLAGELDNNKLRQLTASTGEFLALWEADRSGEGKGAILIVHADGEHLTWPYTSHPLHQTLPDYGWATMAISLPNSEVRPTPARTFPVKSKIISVQTAKEVDATKAPTDDKPSDTNKSDNKNNADGNATFHPIELIAQERLTAAIAFLHDQGQFNIVFVGHGIGALRAHRFMKEITPVITDPKLKKDVEKPISAFISYNGRNALTNDEGNYKHWFFDPEIPFLDIYTITNPRNIKDAKQRHILARQNKALLYQKVKMSEMANEYAQGENRLSRRVRSFIEANARGVEVGNAKVNKN